jgi:hypothetical protein
MRAPPFKVVESMGQLLDRDVDDRFEVTERPVDLRGGPSVEDHGRGRLRKPLAQLLRRNGDPDTGQRSDLVVAVVPPSELWSIVGRGVCPRTRRGPRFPGRQEQEAAEAKRPRVLRQPVLQSELSERRLGTVRSAQAVPLGKREAEVGVGFHAREPRRRG